MRIFVSRFLNLNLFFKKQKNTYHEKRFEKI